MGHYQVRMYPAWYWRYVTLAVLALAWPTITRYGLITPSESDDQEMTSANEIRRIFTTLCRPPRNEQYARRWSRWRQHHQQHIRHCRYQRQRQRGHEVLLEYQAGHRPAAASRPGRESHYTDRHWFRRIRALTGHVPQVSR